MSADIKAELNMPDLWFDFYARFLPGTLFVVCLRYFLLDYKNIPLLDEILGIVFMGYVSALITQPLSSFVVEKLEDSIGTIDNNTASISNREFIRTIQKELGYDTRSALIISKMHAETNFFIQLFFLGIIYFCIQCFLQKVIGYSILINIVIVIIALLNSFEVTYRRFKRVKTHYKLLHPTRVQKGKINEDQNCNTNEKC